MVEIDLDFVESHNPKMRPVRTAAVAALARSLMRLGETTTCSVEGCPPEDRPVILASNHTHVLDYVPLWVELFARDHRLVGWVKARMYKHRVLRVVMRSIGNNQPLVSKGYLIAADFRNLLGRPPTDDEYRCLRDHVDFKGELPARQPYRRVAGSARMMLGRPFNPGAEGWGEAIRRLFWEMMQVTLAKTRDCVAEGYHVHIYPEGQVTRRMTAGHIGVIHAALALSLPIVPVGISGADRAFLGDSPITRGGEIRIRFGEPWAVDPEGIGEDFRPFHPYDQREYRGLLQRRVDELMCRIEKLVDDEYRYTRDSRPETTRGVGRFY